MIITGGKKATSIYRGSSLVTQIFIGSNCVYSITPSDKYLYTDKKTIWCDNIDTFNIFSNVDWIIHKEGEEPYLTVSKNVLWAEPYDNFDINSNSNWIITN